MKQIFLIHGMKRSGNHGIINWLKPQSDFFFLNNIIPLAPFLRNGSVYADPIEFNDWLIRRLRAKGLGPLAPLRAATLRNRRLLCSLEDHGLQISPFRNPLCPLTNILIIRDAENLFASRIHKAFSIDHISYPRTPGPILDRSIRLWKEHAREYLEDTQLIPERVCIYFNSWFSDIDYRKEVSRKLKLNFTDRGFHKVSQKGGGSSFDQTRFNDNAQAMGVLNRSEKLTGPARELYEYVFSDKELCALNERIMSLHS